MTRRFLTMIATVFLSMAAISGQVTTRYVNNDITCVNSAAGGSEAFPLCSMSYVASLDATGMTYLVDSTRDLSGPTFDAVGLDVAPIIYRSRNNTRLGGGIDLIDANFVPHVSGTPGVFTLTTTQTAGIVWQTYYPNIVVDDLNNPTYFEMDDARGPQKLMLVSNDTQLFLNEGSYRFTAGALQVHTHGNLTPSVAATDLVLGQNSTLAFDSDSRWLTVDGFRFAYTGSVNAMLIQGQRHTIKNSSWSGHAMRVAGSFFTGENLRVAHVIERQTDGDENGDGIFEYWTLAAGSAATISAGSGHRFYNIEVMHSWNASLSQQGTSLTNPPIADRVKAHGSPNHCSVLSGDAGISRNVAQWNCQDLQWIVQPVDPAVNPTGMLMEHHVLPQGLGISVEAETANIGKLTVRNSIIRGNFTYIRGLDSRCFWGNTTVEYSIIATDAYVERCPLDGGAEVPIATYIANCAAKIYTNCITFVNNIYLAPGDFDEAVTGGMWTNPAGNVGGTIAVDTWNPTVIEGGPAHDAGVASAVNLDIDGNIRPQGDAPDIGAYEFVEDLGASIYVDNSCPNNGTGAAHTCASSGGSVGAFNALQVALDAANSPGDTVYIKNGSGTYVTTTGSRGQGVELDSGFAITSSGTEANPITIRNYEGHSPLIANCADGVTDYNSCNRLTFSAWCEEGIRITGLRIRGSVGLRCNMTTEATLKRWNEVDHNEITVGFDVFDGIDWAGLTLSNQRFWHVHHNYIHGIAPMTNSGTQSGSSALKLFTAVDGIAEYNTIKDGVLSSAGGIDDKQDAVRNTHRYNWIESVDNCLRFQFAAGPGPYTAATGTVAYQNVCLGRVGSTQPLWHVLSGPVTDVTVYNNVFYRGYRGFRVAATSGPTDGIRHYNNIYELITTHNVQSLYGTTADIDLENYNTYDPDAPYEVAGATYASLAAYVAAVPARNANSTETACTFVATGTDFHLSGGACVNGGRVGGVSSGAAIDRGAYVGGIRCVGYGCEAPTGVK